MSRIVDLLKFTNNIDNNLIAFTSNIESSVISTIDSSTINTFVGMIASFSMATTLEWRTANRWIICDGSAISRTMYSDLFSVISTTWGTGDGSSTFNLPDLRGEFLRGFDNGAGRDPDAASRTGGDAVGSSQSDAYGSHYHSGSTASGYYVYQNMTLFMVKDSPANGGSYRTGSSGGNETRPKNISVQYCIKY